MADLLRAQQGGTQVGLVRAHGFTVAIVRNRGGCLLLEAIMNERPDQVFRASAGTDENAAAAENAVELAAALAAELGVTAAGQPVIIPPSWQQLDEEIRRGDYKDKDGLLSRMRTFMGVFGFRMEDSIGEELGERLSEYRKRFRTELQVQGKAPSTINPYISKLNRLSEIAAGMMVIEGKKLTFAAVLRSASKHKQMSYAALARAIGVSLSAINNWLRREGFPHTEQFRSLVPRIEKVLCLPAGTLVRLIGESRPPGHRRPRPVAAPFAEKLCEAIRESGYSSSEVARQVGVKISTLAGWCRACATPCPDARLNCVPALEVVLGLPKQTLTDLLPPSVAVDRYIWHFNARQQQEWQAFYRHKTERSGPRHNRPKEYWTVRSDGTCRTAVQACDSIRYFYGGLALPADAENERLRGLGIDGDSLSLVDFANPAYLQAYVAFRRRRSGRDTWWTVSFLAFVRSLLRKGTGYLVQGEYQGWRTFPPDALWLKAGEQPDGSFNQWRRHCRRVHQWITEWMQDLREVLPKSRDYSHISEILKLDRPMDALSLLIRRMERDFAVRKDYMSASERAALVRDLLLVCMLVRNPLRKKHWVRMTFGPAGHLRRKADGNYELAIPKEEFKALAAFRDEDYLADVDPALTPLIDEYLTVYRPLLVGAETSDLLFRPQSVARHDARDDQPIKNVLWLNSITARYIPEFAPRGFSFHAVRHIIATHLVRNHSDGIRKAADALHNTEKMIRDVYGHLRGRDLTRKAHGIIRAELEISDASLT